MSRKYFRPSSLKILNSYILKICCFFCYFFFWRRPSPGACRGVGRALLQDVQAALLQVKRGLRDGGVGLAVGQEEGGEGALDEGEEETKYSQTRIIGTARGLQNALIFKDVVDKRGMMMSGAIKQTCKDFAGAPSDSVLLNMLSGPCCAGQACSVSSRFKSVLRDVFLSSSLNDSLKLNSVQSVLI